MSRPPIADDLREYADYLYGCETISEDDHMVLAHIANKIDAEHRTRMYQQSRDIRKAACRYLAAIVEDYKRGRKRKRQ